MVIRWMNEVGKGWFIVTLLLWSLGLWGQEIAKVKGQQVLIRGGDFSEGEQLYVYNDSGKKAGLLEVTKVQGERIIAKILKGKAQPGWSVSAKEDSSKSKSSSSAGKPIRKKWGVLGGLAQNQMSIKLAGTTTDYAGSSFHAMGFFDIPFSTNLVMRGKGGIYQFTVQKNSAGASFNYLGLEGSLQYYLGNSFWLGGGGAFLLTASKSSNIPGLDASSSTNSYFFGGVGFDWRLGKNTVLPLALDYAMFPGSSGVSASSMIIRAGYSWAF
jgi:hypothetical protein